MICQHERQERPFEIMFITFTDFDLWNPCAAATISKIVLILCYISYRHKIVLSSDNPAAFNKSD